VPSWFHWKAPQPPEHPAVALIEEILGESRRYEATPDSEVTAAKHALWICACETLDEAPVWLIHDTPDGDEVVWCRVPVRISEDELVDARFTAGSHLDSDDFLSWLRGESPDPWTWDEYSGDPEVLDELGVRLVRRE
jgi:hypothetical protein